MQKCSCELRMNAINGIVSLNMRTGKNMVLIISSHLRSIQYSSFQSLYYNDVVTRTPLCQSDIF